MSTGQYRPISAVVLAAGEGTRMRSDTPKVLHALCGRPMLLKCSSTLSIGWGQLGGEVSNLDLGLQRTPCCRYTTPDR